MIDGRGHAACERGCGGLRVAVSGCRRRAQMKNRQR